METCKECRSPLLLQTQSDVVCSECGLVSKEDAIFDYPVGYDPMECERSGRKRPALYTSMFGEDAAEASQAEPKRLKTAGAMTVQRRRNMFHRLESYVARVTEMTGITEGVLKTAQEFMATVAPSGPMKIGRQRVLMTSCIYYACKHHSVPRTLKEMADAAYISKKALNKCLNDVGMLLDPPGSSAEPPSASSTAESLLARCTNSLGLPDKAKRQVTAKARDMLRNCATRLELQGKSPNTVAGVYMILASESLGLQDLVSVHRVSEAVGITAFTLRKTVSSLSDKDNVHMK